jgi:predicted alpha/beta superfamily hydrolase
LSYARQGTRPRSILVGGSKINVINIINVTAKNPPNRPFVKPYICYQVPIQMIKHHIITLCLLFMATAIKAQETTTAPLCIGTTTTIHSAILSEERTLNIYLPAGYDSNKAGRYPVIYLLDGSINEDFLHITGLVQFFQLMMNMPNTIVVGIANVDRKRDFTFPTTIAADKKQYPTTGHSENFIRFMEQELQPYIQSHYQTNATKYLIGQSLGGLVATEILLKKPSLFTHYIIVSPSLWWDNESLLKQAPALLARQGNDSIRVIISVGKEGKIMEQDAAALATTLKNAGPKHRKIDFNKMLKENHATILHLSVYESLKRLFPYKEN